MIWSLTNGLKGHDIIAQAVASRLANMLHTETQHKVCSAQGFWRWLAPIGPAPYCESDPNLTPPWPDILIACGRTALPAARHLKRRTGCFAVAMQPPPFGAFGFDLIWSPAHNCYRQYLGGYGNPQIISTLTAPHSLSAETLEAARREFEDDFKALPQPRIGVLIGGPNAVYQYNQADQIRLVAALKACESRGAGLIVVPSRRTPSALLALLKSELSPKHSLIWQDALRNPYQATLGAAQGLIVTADSVNMVGEACLPAVPVHIFHPSGGSKKFKRFHNGLMQAGVTERLEPEQLIADIKTGRSACRPSLNSTETIAEASFHAYCSMKEN